MNKVTLHIFSPDLYMEMLQALQGSLGGLVGQHVIVDSSPDVCVKLPEVGFMFSGSLNELTEAIADVENEKEGGV